MEMREKNMVDPCEIAAVAPYLHLRAFSAVDEHLMLLIGEELGAGIVAQRGRGRPAAKNFNIEYRHIAKLAKFCGGTAKSA